MTETARPSVFPDTFDAGFYLNFVKELPLPSAEESELKFRQVHYRLPPLMLEQYKQDELTRLPKGLAVLQTKVCEYLEMVAGKAADDSTTETHKKLVECDRNISRATHYVQTLTTELNDAFFKVPNETAFFVIQLLFPLAIDQDLIFRTLNTWKKVISLMQHFHSIRKKAFDPAPDHVVIPWRPVHALLDHLYNNTKRVMQTPIHDVLVNQIKTHIVDLTSTCRPYYDPKELGAIWRECRPAFHPDSSKGVQSLAAFVLLGPTSSRIQQSKEDVVEIIDFLLGTNHWYSQANWNSLKMSILQRTAINFKHNFDWNIVAEKLFNAILHSFRFPIGSKEETRGSMKLGGSGLVSLTVNGESVGPYYDSQARAVGRMLDNEITSGALWIHLKRFIIEVDVYIRPNSIGGSVNANLLRFFSSLIGAVQDRLKQQLKPERHIPKEYHLEEATIAHLCSLLFPVVLPCLYSKSNTIAKSTSDILWSIALLSPTTVFEPMLKHVAVGLNTFTEKHQTTAALDFLGGVVKPLALNASHRPKLIEFLAEMSPKILICLDANEERRTALANRLLFVIVNQLPVSVLGDESEVVPGVLDAYIAFMRNLTKGGTAIRAFYLSCRTFFASCTSEEVIESCAKKLVRDLRDRGNVSIATTYGVLAGTIVCSNRAVTLKHLIPGLTSMILGATTPEKLLDGSSTTAGIPSQLQMSSFPTISKDEVKWAAQILRGVINASTAESLLPYVETLLACVERLIRPPNTVTMTKMGLKIAQSLLHALTQYRIGNWGRLNPEDAAKGEEHAHNIVVYDTKEVDVTWAKPPQEAISAAANIVNAYTSIGLTLLQSPESEASRLSKLISDSPTASKRLSEDEVEDITVVNMRRLGLWILRHVGAGGWHIIEARRRKFFKLNAEAQKYLTSDMWWVAPTPSFFPDIDHIDVTTEDAQLQQRVFETMEKCVFQPYCIDETGGKKSSSSAETVAADVDVDKESTEEEESAEAKSGSAEAKCIKLAHKVVAVMLNYKSTIGNTHVNTVHMLNDIVRKTFTNIDKKVIRIQALLSGEYFYLQRINNCYTQTTRSQFDLMQSQSLRSSFNRFSDVQTYGVHFYGTTFGMVSNPDRIVAAQKLLDRFQGMLERAKVSAEKERKLADAARGKEENTPEFMAHKAYRQDPPHFEIVAITCLIGQRDVVECIAAEPEMAVQLTHILIEFPDMERKSDETRREDLIRSLSAYAAQHLQPSEIVLNLTNALLAPPKSSSNGTNATKGLMNVNIKTMHVTKLIKYLQMVISFYQVRQRVPLSKEAVKTLLSLTMDKHSNIRRFAISIMTTLFIVLKPIVFKKKVPYPTKDGEASKMADIDVSSPSYQGASHIGLLFLPETMCVDDHVEEPIEAFETIRAMLREACGITEELKAKIDAADGCAEGIPEEDFDKTVEKSWLFDVLQLMVVDNKRFSTTKMHFWKGLSRAVGAEYIVPALLSAARLTFGKAMDIAAKGTNEQLSGHFATISELICASIRSSKRDPKARLIANKALYEMTKTVGSSEVPFEVVGEIVHGMTYAFNGGSSLPEHLTYLQLIQKQLAETVQSSQDVVRYFSFLTNFLLIPSFDLQPHLLRHMMEAITTHQPLFFFNAFNHVRQNAAAIISVVLGAARIRSPVWEANATLQCEIVEFARTMLTGLRDPAEYIEELQAIKQAKDSEQSSVASPSTTEPQQPQKAVDIRGEILTPPPIEGATTAADVEGETKVESERDKQEKHLEAEKNRQLSLAKTILSSFTNISVHVVNDLVVEIVTAFAKILDIRLPESDDFYKYATRCMKTFSFTRMTADSARLALETVADFLIGEKYTFGKSRHAVMLFLSSIRVLAFQHQHQLDRTTIFKIASPVILKALGHSDRRVRDQGQISMAVLIKVAPPATVSGFLSEQLKTIRATADAANNALTPPPISLVPPATTTAQQPLDNGDDAPVAAAVEGAKSPKDGVSPPLAPLTRAPGMTARLSATVALCASLSAFPDSVPKFAPKVMTKLSTLARDRNAEVKTAVRDCFQEWWRNHRDRWAFEHQHAFTEEQREELSDLFQTPTYYV